mmetsp:Transcript_39824/g.72314  ORF Transcript_39824/g.72314 Transcript_39824/m.72314 type:complete len:96 (+) Transcript_39824:141-428(+)
MSLWHALQMKRFLAGPPLTRGFQWKNISASYDQSSDAADRIEFTRLIRLLTYPSQRRCSLETGAREDAHDKCLQAVSVGRLNREGPGSALRCPFR